MHFQQRHRACTKERADTLRNPCNDVQATRIAGHTRQQPQRQRRRASVDVFFHGTAASSPRRGSLLVPQLLQQRRGHLEVLQQRRIARGGDGSRDCRASTGCTAQQVGIGGKH